MAITPDLDDRDHGDAQRALRACLQKVATGPEYSKNLSFDELYTAMRHILAGDADPVQAGVLLIALRMKRETDAENAAALQALADCTEIVYAPVDEVVDIAEPYDGFTRGLPVSPFLPAVLAACGWPSICHGLESVGPKHGLTHRKVLRAAGIDVDLTPERAGARLGSPAIGWAYVDQRAFCPPAHALVSLRNRIVKRPLLSTVETMVGPVRGARHTHLVTGYVHKAYPEIYTRLARHAGFDSLALVRGSEGGVIPSLKQPGKMLSCYGLDDDAGEFAWRELDPRQLGIEATTRAVALPESLGPQAEPDNDALAQAAAEAGVEALRGASGTPRDCLIYGAATVLSHLRREPGLERAAATVREALDSGAALARFRQ